MQGDTFLYGGEDLAIDVTAWRATACENRHLVHVGAFPWPKGSVVRWPQAFDGLVGETAGLFGAPNDDGLSIVSVDEGNLTATVRRMTGGYGY
jgi:hypothetical protein